MALPFNRACEIAAAVFGYMHQYLIANLRFQMQTDFNCRGEIAFFSQIYATIA